MKSICYLIKEMEYYAKFDGSMENMSKKEFCEVYRYVATRPEIYFLLVR